MYAIPFHGFYREIYAYFDLSFLFVSRKRRTDAVTAYVCGVAEQVGLD
jgi:hypothetical protein